MEIRHRIAFNGDAKPAFRLGLGKLVIKFKTSPLPGHTVGLVYFDIAESDPRWSEVEQLIQEHGASDRFDTFFSNREIMEADWVRLMPAFEQGYPQPEEGWEQATYAHECPACGAGYGQKAPFHLAGEPRLGKRDFFSLHWTYTVFCTLGVVESLKALKIRGFEAWEAILHGKNVPSALVSQLVFPGVARAGLADADKLAPETCAQCGITKYGHHQRGYLRLNSSALLSDTDIQLTHEWFGSGSKTGYREILISKRFVRLIQEKGWQGVRLKPILLL